MDALPLPIRALLRGLLLVGSTLLGLLLLEAALHLWYGTPGKPGPWTLVEEYDSPFVFMPRPGTAANNLGIRRSADVSRVPAAGTRRILSYGDSISQGYRLDESETYAHLLEQRLDGAGGVRREVLSMARGHSPTIHAFHIRHDVPALQPAGVILEIELLNDVSDEAHVRTVGRDMDGLPLEIRRYRYILGWDGHILAPLTISGAFFERTKLYAKLTRWWGRNMNRLRPNPIFAEDSPVTYYSLSSDRYLLTEEALSRGFDRLFESLAGIHAYLTRRGVRFLLIILPSRHVYSDDQYTRASLELVRRAERRARELDLPHVSLYEALGRAGGSALFMDFCHPTAHGNRAIADALEPILRGW